MVSACFDWYSAMWQNVSINDIFKYYGFSFGFEDHWSEVYADNQIHFDSFVVCNPLIGQIRIDRQSVLDAFSGVDPERLSDLSADDVLYKVFSRIKVDFPGSGLSFLRDNGFDIDFMLRRPFVPAVGTRQSMHITRIDVAFDFVDQSGNAYWDLKEWLDDPLRQIDMTVSNRVLCGDQQSMKYSVHSGSERTIYIGSTGSDRLLRIYDKKFQFESKGKWDVESVSYRSDFDPEVLPSSWIRFELQLRNLKAHDLVFSDLDFFEMLKYMYDHFKMRKERGGDVIDVWRNLFDWSSIQDSIVLNSHFVQSGTPLSRLPSWIDQFLKSLSLLCAYHDCGELDLECADRLNRLRHSTREHDQRRYKSIINFLHMSSGTWVDPPRLNFSGVGNVVFKS